VKWEEISLIILVFLDSDTGPLKHNFSFLDTAMTTIPINTSDNQMALEPPRGAQMPIENTRQQEFNQSSENFELPQFTRPEVSLNSNSNNSFDLDLDRFKNTRETDPLVMSAPQRK
jgi:hypothetical protein